ncbi:MAG: zinc ribbon domain-containing protein [Acidobacteriota bacterium]
MSLIICPECGHELSTNAVACPNCGYAFEVKTQVVTRKFVEPESKENLPKWILIPAVTIVAILMIIIFVLLRNNSDTANTRNVNVDLTKAKSTPINRETTVREVESNPPSQIIVPSNPTTVNPPSQPVTTVPSSQQTVPSSPAESVKEPDKGMVKIEAKVSNSNGSIQTVRNEKIYLLDEDIETILSKANLEPIESNSLLNSFGLSVMYPERYGEFNRKSLEAIKKHIKYSGLTDTMGKAAIKDVKPESYYLFGITKSKTGFAVWSSPVSINTGENILNLSPAKFNEIDTNGD